MAILCNYSKKIIVEHWDWWSN